MQLIYFIDIFENSDNIASDRFETDSVNVMKNRPLVPKKQRKFQYILTRLSLSKLSLGTTTIVREPYWFVTNFRET